MRRALCPSTRLRHPTDWDQKRIFATRFVDFLKGAAEILEDNCFIVSKHFKNAAFMGTSTHRHFCCTL
jgi:hypothetical protein